MKKTVLVAAVALAASVMTTPLAFAQEIGPGTQECIDATAALKDGQQRDRRLSDAISALAGARAEVAVLVKTYGIPFDVNTVNSNDVEDAVAFLRGLRDKAEEAGDTDQVAKLNNEMDIVKGLRDALNEHRSASEARQAVDLSALDAAQKEACGEDADPTPTETPDPTEDPEPTDEPDPSETPAPTTTPPPFVDLDCADFPLADGRTAQQVLDETPGEDPNGLDADLDRRACEPGQDTAADGSDVGDVDDDDDGTVVTPSGGIQTGVGPA